MTAPARAAIVGSGNIGSALARLFARAGLEVDIANTRGPESLRPLAASIGPGVRPVPLEQAVDSAVILMAIPFGAIEQFGRSRPDWTGRTVVDTTNAFYAPSSAEVLAGRSAGRYAADHLPGADVVRAFNQLPARTLTAELDPAVGRRVVFLSTDVPAAGDRIAHLVDELGLAAVQLGRTDEGGRLIEVPNPTCCATSSSDRCDARRAVPRTPPRRAGWTRPGGRRCSPRPAP